MNDIDQLKLILETIGTTTESAKWVLILWLSLDLAKIVVCWVAGVIALKILASLAISTTRAHNFLRECRDQVIPQQRGTYVSQCEINEITRVLVEKLKATNKHHE